MYLSFPETSHSWNSHLQSHQQAAKASYFLNQLLNTAESAHSGGEETRAPLGIPGQRIKDDFCFQPKTRDELFTA